MPVYTVVRRVDTNTKVERFCAGATSMLPYPNLNDVASEADVLQPT
jgi:hypothetical protein